MEFRIADTFTDSLARLPGQDQKAVKTTAFDLQVNPAHPGLQFHRIERAKDPNFWSVRVNRDIRLIVHRTERSMLLCYVDHHDSAYAWAERRRIERHPRTGAAQLVEIRERVEEVPVFPFDLRAPVSALEAKPPLFARQPKDVLLSYGVPQDWLDAVRQVDEDGLFELAEHLPQEAAEALLDLAVGATPKVAEVLPAHEDAFAHPDAQRRFRVMANVDELRQALDYPWERWAIFLHPAQRELVERRFGGPARVAGSAGTGKTVVALHRAAHLARRDPQARVLVTTFSRRLGRFSSMRAPPIGRVNAVVKAGLGVVGLADPASKLKRRAIGMWRNQQLVVSRGGKADYFLPYGYRSRRSHWYLDTRNREDETFQQEVYEVAAGIARQSGHALVYDVGCGSGKKTIKYFGHLTTVGFEIEPTLSHLRRLHPERAWEFSDFARRAYGPCDLLVCADVIEHVERPDRLLQMIVRMRPQDIVVSTPERDAIVEAGLGAPEGPPKNVFHLREWNLDELRKLLSCYFEILEQRRLISSPTQQLAHCRLRRHVRVV